MKEGHWHAHTKGLPWDLADVVGTVQQVHCSRKRLLRMGLEFHVCTINKSAHSKKVWKLIQWSSYIQNKSISTPRKRVLVHQVRLLGGSRYLSFVPTLGLFLGASGPLPRHAGWLEKGASDARFAQHECGLPESMSDGLDRLPEKPGHTRPDPCTAQHGRLKRVTDLAGRKLVFVVRPANQMSVAQGFFRWVRVLRRSPDTPNGSKNTASPIGIAQKRTAPRGPRMLI